MKKITLILGDDVFQSLDTYHRNLVHLKLLRQDTFAISYDAEYRELLEKVEEYITNKINGILGYNFITKHSSQRGKEE